MKFKDYYKILNVNVDATADEIKTSYRKLARKYHPDLNSSEGSAEKFKEVAEAYEVLKDPGRRAKFDDLRKYGSESSGGFAPPPGWQTTGGSRFQSNAQFDSEFSDFFNSLFTGNRQHSPFSQQPRYQRHKGQDIEIEVGLFLEDTVSQQVKNIEFQLPTQDTQNVKKNLSVKIPQGVKDGERIRLKGQGYPSYNGGESGDLYLHIRIAPHPLFDVQGNDLYLTLPVAPWEAALGTKVTIPTLESNISLSISANSKTGAKLRIKGKGLKRKGVIGDLYAIIKVVMPPTCNEQGKKLWQELSKRIPFDPRSEWSR